MFSIQAKATRLEDEIVPGSRSSKLLVMKSHYHGDLMMSHVSFYILTIIAIMSYEQKKTVFLWSAIQYMDLARACAVSKTLKGLQDEHTLCIILFSRRIN